MFWAYPDLIDVVSSRWYFIRTLFGITFLLVPGTFKVKILITWLIGTYDKGKGQILAVTFKNLESVNHLQNALLTLFLLIKGMPKLMVRLQVLVATCGFYLSIWFVLPGFGLFLLDLVPFGSFWLVLVDCPF